MLNRIICQQTNDYLSERQLNCCQDAVEFISEIICNQDREHLVVLNLDVKNRPINWHIVSIGNLTSSLADIGNIFKTAILSNANGFILFHNHPSGSATPSYEDLSMTSRILISARYLGIQMLDHIVVAPTKTGYTYFSILSNKPQIKESCDSYCKDMERLFLNLDNLEV